MVRRPLTDLNLDQFAVQHCRESGHAPVKCNANDFPKGGPCQASSSVYTGALEVLGHSPELTTTVTEPVPSDTAGTVYMTKHKSFNAGTPLGYRRAFPIHHYSESDLQLTRRKGTHFRSPSSSRFSLNRKKNQS